MSRAALVPTLLLLLPAAARAGEGVQFGLEAGYGFWALDHEKVARQVPYYGDVQLTRMVQNGFSPHIRLGYNILGHLSLEVFFTGAMWNVSKPERGGAGFLGGEMTYHPLQAFLPPDRMFDVGITFGGSYSIIGHGGNDTVDPAIVAVGMDGLAWPLGLLLEVYPAPFISLGLAGRWIFLGYDRFIYNYNQIDTGGSARLPEGSGGGLFSLTFILAFHIATVK